MADNAIALIKKSKRPLIIMGHGARAHKKAIVTFAESLNAAVVTTFKGKGLIADSHPLGCGVLGRSGTPIASWFMNEADLLIVFGASFSNHTGITYKKPTIQIDFDPLALSKFHEIDVAVWGEISRTLDIFTAELGGETETIDQKEEIAERKGKPFTKKGGKHGSKEKGKEKGSKEKGSKEKGSKEKG
jgi:thiamine pyrophosphate-dependent acetolactate synthase large subunit-like protein